MGASKKDNLPRKLFGTDGIRGKANEFPMTSEIAVAVGRAIAHVLQNNTIKSGKSSMPIGLKPLESSRPIRRAKIVIGKDTRLSGYMIEQALTSGICSMGADAIMIGPLPTPGVAFVTQSMRADAGIMISASHNPFYDNGIKIFAGDGFKLPDHLESEIEKLIYDPTFGVALPTGDLLGRAKRIDDVHGRYIVQLKSLFSTEYDLNGMRVVLDCANGAAYKVAPLVLEELGAEVIRVGVAPNGLNINEGCGALHPESLAAKVLQYRANIGIALDGDGDRCILVDEHGEIVDGDQIIGICAVDMAKSGKLKKNLVITTPMSNIGLEMTLKNNGIAMKRAKVGDRYVVEMMKAEGAVLGGEQSGHLVFLEHATTGDGVIAALKVLEIMRKTGQTLAQLKAGISLYPQVRHDVRVARKDPFDKIPEIQKAIEEAETTLHGRGRVFVRYSGTEPLARVMVEGESESEIQGLSQNIASLIQRKLGA